MEHVELVIKIPEDEYKRIKEGKWEGNPLADYIENGTPLLKGHGDLKDIETFKLTYGNDGAYYRFKDIIDAPTIIEADKGEEE